MSRSAIYVANPSDQTVAVNNFVNLGSIQRRFGCDLDLSGYEIRVKNAGYYDVDASISVTSATAGTIVMTLYKDNVPVPGATASATIDDANTFVNLSIAALIREGCRCCDGDSSLSIMFTTPTTALTSITVDNIGVVAERV